MIFKVTRLSRTKRQLVSYVYMPDSYSTHQAINLLYNAKKGIKTNRAHIERVFNTCEIPASVERARVFDVKQRQVKPLSELAYHLPKYR